MTLDAIKLGIPCQDEYNLYAHGNNFLLLSTTRL